MNTLIISKLSATLSAGLLIAMGTAVTAQAQVDRLVRVQVPFAFEQGSKHLAAGQYTITLQGGHLLQVRGENSSAYSLANINESVRPASKSKITFQRYGDRYFLHGIWMAGQSSHVECVQTSAERSLRKELKIASAQKRSTGEEVALLETPR